MATVTAFSEKQNTPQIISGLATIDNGETATLAIPCHGRALVRLGIPSAFTGTSLTFTVQAYRPADPAAPTLAPPFRPLRDAAGNLVTVTVGADRVVEVAELAGCYAFTIVSGSAEGAAREIEVQCVGPYPASPSINNLTVEGGSIAVTSVVPGTGASNLGKAEDSAHTSGDVGVMALAIRQDNETTFAGAAGRYSGFAVSVAGYIETSPRHDAPIGDGGAHPVVVGGRASATAPVAVIDGDAVWAWMTHQGAQVVAGASTANVQTVPTSAVTLGSGSESTAVTRPLSVMQAPWSSSGNLLSDTGVKSGAGVVHAVTFSAADAAATAGTIQVRDSTSAGAGTVMFEVAVPAAAFVTVTILLDMAFGTGLYLDFTTTGDVNVTASYR